MRTSSSQNDKKTFRDDLFEKLANDYILKGRSSVLARFLRDDTQESVEKLKRRRNPKAGAVGGQRECDSGILLLLSIVSGEFRGSAEGFCMFFSNYANDRQAFCAFFYDENSMNYIGK